MEQEYNENVFPIHTSSIHYGRCSGGSLWLQCNQNTTFRKLLVSSEELSWFLVWFFFGSEEVEGNPCKFCTLGEIPNWTSNENKTLELTL
jgi:hypothetical protein